MIYLPQYISTYNIILHNIIVLFIIKCSSCQTNVIILQHYCSLNSELQISLHIGGNRNIIHYTLSYYKVSRWSGNITLAVYYVCVLTTLHKCTRSLYSSSLIQKINTSTNIVIFEAEILTKHMQLADKSFGDHRQDALHYIGNLRNWPSTSKLCNVHNS